MTPKTAEIISRVAAWRDRGISIEAARATLMAQYQFTSLQNAAKVLGVDTSNPGWSVADAVYARKMRTVVVCPDCKLSNADRHYDEQHNICPVYERHWSEAA